MTLSACTQLRGTGDLGIVVERAAGSVLVVETTDRIVSSLRCRGLAIYPTPPPCTPVINATPTCSAATADSPRSICSKAASTNASCRPATASAAPSPRTAHWWRFRTTKPGGVRIFDAQSLAPVAEIPAVFDDAGTRSKVVGLVDAPGRRFVFSLYDADEIWIADLSTPSQPQVQKFTDVGKAPYDAMITPDGRYYVAGLFGEDGLALLDLWHPEKGTRRIMENYGRGEQSLPVYKMPHMEGWAMAGDLAFVPAVGRHEVLVIDRHSWQERARIPVHGQPIFVMARPDAREVWVNFALPDNDTIQIIDVQSLAVAHVLTPGKAVLHMEFTPRGEQVWVSVRDEDRVDVYDTASYERLAELPAAKPSGIFLAARAHRIGL